MARVGFWRGGRREAAASTAPIPDAIEPSPEVAPRSSLGLRRNRGEALLLLQTYEESGQGWFWSTDADGRLTYLTDHVAPLLSDRPDELLGAAFADLFQQADEGVRTPRTLPFILMKKCRFDKLTVRAIVAGEERWWSLSGSPQADALGQFAGYRGSGINITEQHRSAEHAARLAMYDSLTGLHNRVRMAETLAADLVALEVQKRSCAVMLIDLDRFKQVNDTLGHPAGDALLVQVAERLRKIAGGSERVFRLGGDEFQIIVQGCEDRGVLGDLAKDIIASLSQPYSVGGSRCIIGASVGVAISPHDGRTSEELIRNADLALYAAKESGRGRFRFFSNELLQAAADKRALEEDLRDALARGEIELFYQPIVNAVDNITTGVEALVRWNHPERGPISPALFIPIAEEANLIEQLGEWVLRKACEDAAGWPGSLRVAVNVSPIQFTNEALPAIVMSALANAGLAPARLELEITEGVFLSESTETDTMFGALKEIGVRLALDDFGTGYSSLSYLRTAPFDKIKIDQSFVRAATLPGSRNRAIIAAIVALAEAMDMETTAEGIESLDQLELVRALRVSHVQGYVYSKAVPRDEMRERLGAGDWMIAPSGPARQRSARHSMYRNAGVIFGSYYRSVLVRNLSESGALIEGPIAVPVGSLLLVDFGEGQLVFARVRRAHKNQYGVEFEQLLVSDGNGGLCTSRRVPAHLLAQAGLPSAARPGAAPDADAGDSSALEQLRAKLGLNKAPQPIVTPIGGGDGPQATRPVSPPRPSPTIEELSVRYLEHVAGDSQRHEIDAGYLQQDILPHFGAMRPEDLAPSRVAAWLSAKVREEGAPPAKVTRLQGIMGQMYVLAMQWGMADGGDGEALQGIAMFNRRERERCLTSEEVERLTEAAEASHNPQLKFIIRLLMLTGTRQRELLEARWDHVDLDQGKWRIPTSASAKVRAVALSPAAVEAFRALPRWPGCPHVIANPVTRKPYRSFFASWDTARKKAGLWDVEIDDLRHSMAGVGSGAAGRGDLVEAMLGRAKRTALVRTAAL